MGLNNRLHHKGVLTAAYYAGKTIVLNRNTIRDKIVRKDFFFCLNLLPIPNLKLFAMDMLISDRIDALKASSTENLYKRWIACLCQINELEKQFLKHKIAIELHTEKVQRKEFKVDAKDVDEIQGILYEGELIQQRLHNEKVDAEELHTHLKSRFNFGIREIILHPRHQAPVVLRVVNDIVEVHSVAQH